MFLTLAENLILIPRIAKRAIALVVDTFLCFASVQFAFFLRLGEWESVWGRPLHATIAAIAIGLPIFVTQGLYRSIFRYSGVAAMQAIARSALLFAIPYTAIFTLVGVAGTPRTVGFIEPILIFLFIAGSRGFANWWLGAPYRRRFVDKHRPRALIYGAGEAGRQLASAIGKDGELRIVGFIDDDKALRGSTIAGIPIYEYSEVARMIENALVDEVLLALPKLSRNRRLTIVEELTEAGILVRLLPTVTDIVRGKIEVSSLKHVAIEDLLSRNAVPPEQKLLDAAIRDRTVLVSGAGGSIGSELCRQIMAIGPRRLVMVDSSEFNLYSIDAELRALRQRGSLPIEIKSILGSVRDRKRMEEVCRSERPATIYHAAAYKHVPLVEANPIEGVENNVIGTYNMVNLASQYGIEYFICVSTDKAVRPTNIMGASKRLAELVVQAYSDGATGKRKYSMVRFGNVLGSSGSVVPLFRKQIAEGGPVTVTDPEMTRYFMTIPEAAQLVIQAGAMANGGEVFVLDMGQPVRIMDLARNMIRLSGLSVRDENNADGDIEIDVVGRRPGEKLYEELLIGDNAEPSPHPRIMKAHEHSRSMADIDAAIDTLQSAVANRDIDLLLSVLFDMVPEYAPVEIGRGKGTQACRDPEAPRKPATRPVEPVPNK